MTDALERGRCLSHYRVLGKPGAGGMGEVYLAEDLQLGRKVALKVLPNDLDTREARLRRFEREARVVSALNHPNILTVHDVLDCEGRTVMVTEYVEGETLRVRLERTAVPYRETVRIAIQIGEALTAAHGAGIVHRDIKPENVVLRPDGYAKVLDFGLAKWVSGAPLSSDSGTRTAARHVSVPGVVLGSFRYMSPEQARGLELDARTDIFSLGAVLYEMIAGQQPFTGPTATDVVAAILNEEASFLGGQWPETPAELERIVRKALQKKREERYQIVKDMVLDLRALESNPESARRGWSGALSPTSERQATRRRRSRRVGSLAVLPLANQSGDAGTEYLSDGITETVIINLSQLPRLKVMSRSAVFRLKGKDRDPIEAGRELGVEAVLTGRVLQIADRLRISMELVEMESGFQLWGAHYDRKLADIFSVQEEIAEEVSRSLRLKLSPDERKKLLKRHTADVAAYQDYLRGRYSWNRRTEEGLRRSLAYFESAIKRDPTYGAAYAGLADAYAILGMAEYGALAPSEVMPRAKAAAQRAMEIDPSLGGQARTTLAHVTAFYDWNWPEAEQGFKEAIQLDPMYPFSHHWYALFLAALKRPEEALAEEKRAQELDPLSLIISKNVGTIYYYARRNKEAIDQYRKTLELDPDFVRTHYFLGLAYLSEGLFDEAVSELQRAIQLSDENSVFLGTLGFAYARAGREEQAHDQLTKLKRRSRDTYVPALNSGLVFVGLGETDSAFASFEEALKERSSWLVSLRTEPMFDDLRSDPRFEELARRVGLPDH